MFSSSSISSQLFLALYWARFCFQENAQNDWKLSTMETKSFKSREKRPLIKKKVGNDLKFELDSVVKKLLWFRNSNFYVRWRLKRNVVTFH